MNAQRFKILVALLSVMVFTVMQVQAADELPGIRAEGDVPTVIGTGGGGDPAAEVVQLLNSARVNQGLGCLVVNVNLTTAAVDQSQYMADTGDFSHTREDGTTFVDRARAAGYTNYGGLAENIAYGYSTPNSVYQGWYNSSGHHKNMFNSKYNEIGVGVISGDHGIYWTMMVGSRSGVDTSLCDGPSPEPSGPETPTNVTLSVSDAGMPQVSWNDDPAATNFQVWVGTADYSSTAHFGDHTRSGVTCNGTTCTLSINGLLIDGRFLAFVRASDGTTWSSSGEHAGWGQSNTADVDTPVSSVTSADSGTPRLEWAGSPLASSYGIWLGTAQLAQIHYAHYAASDLGCGTGGTCAITLPSTYLSNGDYVWYIQPVMASGTVSGGAAGWAEGQPFSVNAPQPTTPAFDGPSGQTTSDHPVFTWAYQNGMTWYNIWIGTNHGDGTYTTLYYKWHSAADLNCGSGTCTLDPGVTFNNGDYEWYLQVYSPANISTWNGPQAFNVGG